MLLDFSDHCCLQYTCTAAKITGDNKTILSATKKEEKETKSVFLLLGEVLTWLKKYLFRVQSEERPDVLGCLLKAGSNSGILEERAGRLNRVQNQRNV